MVEVSVVIDYGVLRDAAKDLEKAAGKCDKYANQLQKKVPNKLGNLTKGSSTYTSNASYFASAKIQKLDAANNTCATLSTKITTFVTKAQETDRKVANYIKTEGNDFRKANGLSYGWFDGFAEAIARFGAMISDASDFSRWITDKLRGISDAINAGWLKAKHWLWCDGGKYVIKAILSAVAVVFAVVAAIAACVVGWPALLAILAGTLTWANIVAVCAMITAVIAVVDFFVSACTNTVAALKHKTDPGWASRYSSMDSLSTWLYKTNFDNKFFNIISNWTSVGLDVISTICAVVTIVDGIRNVYRFFKNIGRKNANWKYHFKMWDKNGKFSFEIFKNHFSHNVKAFYNSFKNNRELNQMQGVAKRKYKWYNKFSKFTKGTTFKNIKTGYNNTKAFINNLVNGVTFKDYINSKIEKAVMEKVDPLDVKGTRDKLQKVDKKLAEMAT